jgi:hypothetical protein
MAKLSMNRLGQDKLTLNHIQKMSSRIQMFSIIYLKLKAYFKMVSASLQTENARLQELLEWNLTRTKSSHPQH